MDEQSIENPSSIEGVWNAPNETSFELNPTGSNNVNQFANPNDEIHQRSTAKRMRMSSGSICLHRLDTFIYNDFNKHINKSGATQSTNLQLYQHTRLSMYKTALIENGRFPSIKTVIQSGGTNRQIMTTYSGYQNEDVNDEDNLFNKLKPIIKKIPSTIAILGGPSNADRRKIVTTFGRMFFDTIFTDGEILFAGKATKLDTGKINMVARAIAWVMSVPDKVSIENFIIFSEGLFHDKTCGLSEEHWECFWENIVKKHSSDRRVEIQKSKGK